MTTEINTPTKNSKIQNWIQTQFGSLISSIHRFLVVSMLSILILVMGLLAFVNYWQIQQQDKRLFDAQLVNSAQVLEALMSLELDQANKRQLSSFLRTSAAETIATLSKAKYAEDANLFEEYQNEIVFQVWDLKNQSLLLKSSNAPDFALSSSDNGFQHTKGVQGNYWYAYSITNPKQETKVIIGMRDSFASSIDFALFLHDLTILIIIGILIAISILWAIQYSLKPIKEVTMELKQRTPTALHPIQTQNMPTEIRPLLKAINKLFIRLDETMQREKSFTADAAHELRTPLAALKTQVQVAVREKNEEQRQNIFKNIIRGSNRCAHVVDQLLTLSRLSPEVKTNYETPVILNDIAEELVAELAPLAINKNIDIELLCPETPLSILGDKIGLGILMRNLIANAIIYTPEDGQVHVVLSELKSKIILQVIDSGPGIPKELHTRIFDRFYRQLGNKAEGSGLGLSIVKKIVELHQARIEPKTPKSGIGLEMCVTFNKATKV